MLTAEQIHEVRVAARVAAQDKIEEAEHTRTRNIYKDIEAIESRLDDRIDGLEARSDAAIKSLTKVLAEELGLFCRREVHDQLSGHAADWKEAMEAYDAKLAELHERLDSARERGTGGVQDCMKLLTELNAEVKRIRSVNLKNLLKNDECTDQAVEKLREDFEAHRHPHGATKITQGGRMESTYIGPKGTIMPQIDWRQYGVKQEQASVDAHAIRKLIYRLDRIPFDMPKEEREHMWAIANRLMILQQRFDDVG